MKQITKLAYWRERLISFTGKDPLRCPICRREMKLVEVAYFSSKSGSLALYHPTQLLLNHDDQINRKCGSIGTSITSLEVLRLFPNFAPVSGFISGSPYSFFYYLSLFFSPPHKNDSITRFHEYKHLSSYTIPLNY